MMRKASANSATASCSHEPKVVARFSKYTDKAASIPPLSPHAITCHKTNENKE